MDSIASVYSARMSGQCAHARMVEGLCPDCGFCEHAVILNGVCMACGSEDLAVTIKPDEPGNFVPLAEVVRKPRDD